MSVRIGERRFSWQQGTFLAARMFGELRAGRGR